jgi:hypothetical protein
MAVNANNILIGAATVSLNGTDVGYTRGGTTVRYESTAVDVDADQTNGIVRKGRAMERQYVVVRLLEVSLEQMRVAMMFPSANLSGSTLTLGYNGSCWTDEVAIVLVGPGPDCGTRTFSFTKGVSLGTREYNMQRDNPVEYEVELEILKDSSGNFGSITDS